MYNTLVCTLIHPKCKFSSACSHRSVSWCGLWGWKGLCLFMWLATHRRFQHVYWGQYVGTREEGRHYALSIFFPFRPANERLCHMEAERNWQPKPGRLLPEWLGKTTVFNSATNEVSEHKVRHRAAEHLLLTVAVQGSFGRAPNSIFGTEMSHLLGDASLCRNTAPSADVMFGGSSWKCSF